MLKLEARPQPSTLWTYTSPLLALALTVLIGMALFSALGKDPVRLTGFRVTAGVIVHSDDCPAVQ